MAGLTFELIDTLERQFALFDELIAYAAEKKDLIVGNKTSDLSKLTADENSVVVKLQKLDKSRAVLMNDIANVLGKTQVPTLTELAEMLKETPEYERIKDIAVRTRAKLEELKALNDQNKILVDSSLDYINFTINAIRSSLLPEQAIYSKDGEELGVRHSFFDAKQ